MKFSLLLTSALLLAVSGAAYAQSDGKKKEPPPQENSKAPPVSDTVTAWKKAETEITSGLSKRDSETFNILYNKHSFIQVIGVVDSEIGTAVKACGDANKDVKPKIETRYKQWQGAVLPIVETARKQLAKDIDAQKSVEPDKFRALLKLRDQAYDEGNKKIVKKPVTSKEACEGLIASMDRTEDEMITILQETLLPESVIRTRYSQKPAAGAAKAETPVKTDEPAKTSTPSATPKE